MGARTVLWFDPEKVGPWSEVKQDILKTYATVYSRILSAQSQPRLHHVYIDAFAGSGVHLSRQSGQLIRGSPLNALDVNPPFRDYHFIDLDGDKVERLHELVGERSDVHLYHGDSNNLLINEVFPQVDYKDYRRGLCLFDPYGMQLEWDVIEAAAKLGTLDIFINFPTMDMNRSVLRKDPEAKVSEKNLQRMNAFWGDESWKGAAYSTERGLFDYYKRKQTKID